MMMPKPKYPPAQVKRQKAKGNAFAAKRRAAMAKIVRKQPY